jgi:RHS repeat-associated protein
VKETDYFGFGEFTVLDAYGTETVARYNAMPYDDFRMNRALAGGVKETLQKGNDGTEYARTEYDYEVREITTSLPLPTGEGGDSVSSFIVVPAAVRTYRLGMLAETRESSVELLPGRYGLKSRTEAVTDHYEDPVHAPVTVRHYSGYENIEETNLMLLSLKKNFTGSANETATYCEYDERGNLVRERTSYTGTGLAAAADRIMEYGYDECGNRVIEKDASGSPARIVEKSYDHELRQFLVRENTAGDRLDLVTSYERDYGAAFGAVVKKTAPDGNSRYCEYDALGRPARERADFDSGTETTAEYAYSDLFPLSGKAVQFTGAGGDIETRVYVDGMGRQVHTVRSASGETGRRYVKSGPVAYDRAGRVIRRSRPSFAQDAEIDDFTMEWREKDPTVTEYDVIGRVARITLPKTGEEETGVWTSYTYNGPWQVTEMHSIGRSKRTVHNARGLVLYVEESGTGDDGAMASAMIGFAYDAAGNRVKKMDLSPAAGLNPQLTEVPVELFRPGVRDSSGANIACWRYDGFGRLKEESDPDRGYASYEYDPFGAVAARTDALGRVTSYSYDRLGRVTEKLLPGDEGRVAYTYDEYRGSDNARGRLAHVDDPVQETTVRYDRAGRVREEDRRVKTSSTSLHSLTEGRFLTSYRYDLPGRKTDIRYPAASPSERRLMVSYRYCAMGVTAVETDDGEAVRPIVRSVSYDETGRMAEVRRGNGSVSSYEYDARGRLSHLLTTTEHNGRTWTVQDVAYAFRADDSIAGTENRPDVSAEGACESLISYRYGYDGLNRLVRAEGRYEKNLLIQSGLNPTLSENTKHFDLAYRYAPNGNLTGKTVYDPDTGAEEERWDYSYDNHAVTGIDTSRAGARFSMRYDAAGNMTHQRDHAKGRAKEMAYDSANRVRRVTDPDSGEIMGRYDYDDGGSRVRKVSRQLVDGEERYVETLSASIYLTLERQKTIDGRPVRGTGSSVSHIYLNGVRVAAIASSGDAYYYLTDQVDSVQVTLDEAGKIVAQQEYLPYGEAWVSGGEEKLAPKYNSQELDRETGFYFYNARHYDPEVGRFVTADSVVDGEYSTQGWNRFAYVKGNPIIYKDPTGFETAWYSCGASGEQFTREYSPAAGSNPSNRILNNTSNNNLQAQKLLNSKDSMTVKQLESIIRKRFNKEVNLKESSHHVMLENFFDYDESLSQNQKRDGSYSAPRGKDTMRATYFIIENGEIINRGYGTSKVSLYSENSGNDLEEGIFKFHGETNHAWITFRYARIFQNESQMNNYYKLNGQGIYNPNGDTSVPVKQRSILEHYPNMPGDPGGSGGKGCQLFEFYDSWSRSRYTDDSWRQYKGNYYKIDMNSVMKRI